MTNRKMLMKIRKNRAEGDELTGEEEASVSSSEQYTRFSSNQVDSSGHSSLSLVFPSSSSNDATAEALLSLFPSSSLPGSSMDQSQDPWEVTQFTHEEVVNGVIGYFVGEETLRLFQAFSESILDEMDITVSAAGVQPGNFKLSFMIMRVPVIMTPSSPVNGNNHSASTTSDPSSRSNDFSTKKRPTVTNSSFDQGVNYLSIMITKDHLIASGLILFFCLASILILILMKAFNLFKIEDQRQADQADASKTKGSSNATPVVTTNVISRHDNFSCSPSPSSPASSAFSRSHHPQHHHPQHHHRTQSECSCPCKEQYKSPNVTQQLQGNSLQPVHSVNNTLRRSYRLNHRQSYPHVIPHQTHVSNISENHCDGRSCPGSSPGHGYYNNTHNLTPPSGSCSPSTTGTDTGIGGCSSLTEEKGRGVNTGDLMEKNDDLSGQLLLMPPPPDVSALGFTDFSGMESRGEGHLDMYTANSFGHSHALEIREIRETRFNGSQDSSDGLYPLPPPALYFGGNPEEDHLRRSIFTNGDNCFIENYECSVDHRRHHNDNEGSFNRSGNTQSSVLQQQTNIGRQSSLNPWREDEEAHSSQQQTSSSDFCDENHMFLLLTQDQEGPHFKNMYDVCQQEIRSPSTQAVSMTGILSSFQTSPHHLPVPPSFQSASCLNNKNNNNHSICVSTRRNDFDSLNSNSLTSVTAPLDRSGGEEVTIEKRSFENGNTLRRRILLMDRTSGPTTGSTDKSNSESENNSQTVQCPVLQESRGGEGRKGITREEDADAGNISSFSSTSASPSICLDNNRRHSLSRHHKQIEPASHSSSSHPLQTQMPSSCQTQRMSVGGGEKRLTGVSSSFTRDDDGGEEQFWV